MKKFNCKVGLDYMAVTRQRRKSPDIYYIIISLLLLVLIGINFYIQTHTVDRFVAPTYAEQYNQVMWQDLNSKMKEVKK